MLQNRIERVAPGEERFETVPQIFHDGVFIGGFEDLCIHLEVDDSLAKLFLAPKGNGDKQAGAVSFQATEGVLVKSMARRRSFS